MHIIEAIIAILLIARYHYDTMQEQARLQALYHLAVELSAQQSLDKVLQTALRHCLTLTESQFGFIGLNSDDGRALDVVAMDGFHPATDFYDHFHMIPLRPNVFARAVLENRPIRSADAMTDPIRVGQPQGHPPVHAFLGVPLRIQGDPIGMIGVANRITPYDADHEQLLLTYAAQVAIVTRNRQLWDQLTQANRELELKVAERNRLLKLTQEALTQSATQIQILLKETVDVIERERISDNSFQLSEDERQILSQLANGQSNADIAQALFVSTTTLKRKLRTILDKMQTQTRTQAVAEAVRRGLV